MRLDLELELRPLQRFKGRMMKLMTGATQLPGPIVVASYAPELFGTHFGLVLEQAMRKMTHWSVGEVELFAAFVSKQNRCAY
jgi:hypothetical protein